MTGAICGIAGRMRKRGVQALDVCQGFGDFMRPIMSASRVFGVECESDDREGFMGWRTQKTIRIVTDTIKYKGSNMCVA